MAFRVSGQGHNVAGQGSGPSVSRLEHECLRLEP